jgi:glycine/D-amino acid oxidase-like deaminating enzyme
MGRGAPTFPDVIVIGGGIIGTSTAYYLARRGVRVTLLEKGEIGGEQSSRNWGFIRRQGRDPAEIGLAARANTLYAGLEAEIGQPFGWVRGGNLRVAEDDAKMRQYREWFAETDAGRTLGTRLVDPIEIRELVPGMRGEWTGGMYTALDGHADPDRVTIAMAAAATRAGAAIDTGVTVLGIETTNGQVSGVRTTTGPRSAGTVVSAAGIWTARLLRPLGIRIPLRWVRGTVSATQPLPRVTDLAVWTPGVAFRQSVDGRVILGLSGASDFDITLDSLKDLGLFLPNYRKNWRLFRFHVGRMLLDDVRRRLPGGDKPDPFTWDRVSEPPPNPAKVARTQTAFAALFPDLPTPVIQRSWAGYMDATPDGLPVIGPADQLAGLYIAGGFSGHGFGLGPAVGQAVAELVTDGRASLDLSGLRPERFWERGRVLRARSVT